MKITSSSQVFTSPYYHTQAMPQHVHSDCNLASVRDQSQNRHYSRMLYRMKRIVIIGSSGSGKSTLARKLGEELGLPVYHLDKYYWNPGWEPTPQTEWRQTVHTLAQRTQWILDGNYRSTLPERLQLADTVIFLDLPRWLCMSRAIKRRFQYMREQRPDIADGCSEPIIHRSFPRFLRWIWQYPQRARPEIITHLQTLPTHKQVIWLQSRAEVHQFLEAPKDFSPLNLFTKRFYESPI